MNLRSLHRKFMELPPNQKKGITFGLLAVVVLIFAWFMYREKAAKPVRKPAEKYEEVVPEVKVLEKDLYYQTTRKTRELEKKLSFLQNQLLKTQKQLEEAQKAQKERYEELLRALKSRPAAPAGKERAGRKVSAPGETIPPPPRAGRRTPPPLYVPRERQRNAPPGWAGGIGEAHQESSVKPAVSGKPAVAKKGPGRKKRTVYLPPSFVEADLLNGFAALTTSAGKSEPVRALFRIHDLAVLPNDLKADLKGCFVIGEAYGNLADERAHVRLLRLSCIARDGTSVIDEPVKGWVADEDGRAGLRGHVVTKMGAFLTRYLLAGFIEGFGQAYSQSQYTFSVGGGNVVQLAKPSEAAKAGLGKGIAKMGKGLADFYLQLAKQTLPVIEVGAGKRVTIIFTEGRELTIRKTCISGRDGCEEHVPDAYGVLAGYYGG